MRIVKDPEAQYYTPGTGITIVNGVISVDIGSTSTTVSAGNHDHDEDYAAIDHNHDEDYAAIDHNHDEDYAAIDHDHGDYYDLRYAPIIHEHDEQYADLYHDHGDEYAAAEHEHSWEEISDAPAIGTSYSDISSVSDEIVTGAAIYNYIENRLESVTTGGTRRDIYINDSVTPIYSGDDLRLIAGTGITLQPAQSGQTTEITISGTNTDNNNNSSSGSGNSNSNNSGNTSVSGVITVTGTNEDAMRSDVEIDIVDYDDLIAGTLYIMELDDSVIEIVDIVADHTSCQSNIRLFYDPYGTDPEQNNPITITSTSNNNNGNYTLKLTYVGNNIIKFVTVKFVYQVPDLRPSL